MDLKCKILPEYLDRILAGEKIIEARQFEKLILTDGTRIVETEIKRINRAPDFMEKNYRRLYPNIPWVKELSIYEIYIKNPKLIQDGQEATKTKAVPAGRQ